MKISQRLDFNGDGTAAGSVKFHVADDDDLWHLANLIAIGDVVTAHTTRKVLIDSQGNSERKHMNLTLTVTKLDFDFGLASALRVSGTNCRQNEWVALGQYHTHTITARGDVVLEKTKWDARHLATLKELAANRTGADVAVVLLHEGLAHVLLVGHSRTVVVQRIDQRIPKKRRATRQRSGPQKDRGAEVEKAVASFFDAILRCLASNIRFPPKAGSPAEGASAGATGAQTAALVRAVVLASPGFWKDDLLKHVLASTVPEVKALAGQKHRFVLARAGGGWRHCLAEVLSQKAVADAVADTRAAEQSAALHRFHEHLEGNTERAVYGPREVMTACQRDGLVDELLLSDALLRVQRPDDVPRRATWVAACEAVEQDGGTVHVFSAAHVSGEQLGLVSGAAAILRMPTPDLARGLVDLDDGATGSSDEPGTRNIDDEPLSDGPGDSQSAPLSAGTDRDGGVSAWTRGPLPVPAKLTDDHILLLLNS
eukprot:TRINITY_DN21885_c0_g1_i1.p1 TRINITY_DN21885_c0_g1~~TRINITY_DN21885_c0_g1_i1.p1  ORF type:complete len:484 (+),score=102.69 TRINITY_DN21885_c0_g1_i1:91-1542(+)